MGETRQKSLVDATSIRQLTDRVGRQKAGEMIGCSPTNFGRWLQTGKAPTCYEMAARYFISKTDREQQGAAVLVVSVPAKDRQVIDAILSSLKLDHKYFCK